MKHEGIYRIRQKIKRRQERGRKERKKIIATQDKDFYRTQLRMDDQKKEGAEFKEQAVHGKKIQEMQQRGQEASGRCKRIERVAIMYNRQKQENPMRTIYIFSYKGQEKEAQGNQNKRNKKQEKEAQQKTRDKNRKKNTKVTMIRI